MRKILVVLIFLLISSGNLFAQSLDIELNPYEIGVNKTIEVEETLVIAYTTNLKSQKEVTLEGSISISKRYVVDEIQLGYYIVNSQQEVINGFVLELEKNSNVFKFFHTYPLDLFRYEYEVFLLVLVIEDSTI
jgi:hypothetical protein